MGEAQPVLIETGEIPEYPISASERLDSHYWLRWNLKRWRTSTFRRTCDPEVGWYGFLLFCVAQDETPIGTLPCDDVQLSHALNLSVEQWKAMLQRKVSPLWGWYRVRCETGEIRLGHKVVIEIAEEALKSKRRTLAKNAEDRMRKRLQGIREVLLSQVTGGDRIARSDEMVNQLSDWIEAAYPGGSATSKRVKEALAEVSQGWS